MKAGCLVKSLIRKQSIASFYHGRIAQIIISFAVSICCEIVGNGVEVVGTKG